MELHSVHRLDMERVQQQPQTYQDMAVYLNSLVS